MSNDARPQRATITGKDALLVTLAMLALLLVGIAANVAFMIVTTSGRPDFRTPSLDVILFGYGVSVVAMLGSVHLVLVRRRGLTWSDIGFAPVPVRWIVLAVGVGAAVVPAVGLIEWALGLSLGKSAARLIAPHGFSWAALIGTVIFLGLLTPLAEEVYYRGIVYRWMRGRWSLAVAVPASALVFGFTHVSYPLPFMLVVAAFGVVLALAYERSTSLWPPVAIHATNNSLGILLIYGSLAR